MEGRLTKLLAALPGEKVPRMCVHHCFPTTVFPLLRGTGSFTPLTARGRPLPTAGPAAPVEELITLVNMHGCRPGFLVV